MKKIKTRQSQSSKWKFHKVLDTKGNPVRYLWIRNGRYYAQLTVKDADGRPKNTKFPIQAQTLSHAKAAVEDMRTKRRQNQLASTPKAPRFHAFCDLYLKHQLQIRRKKPASLKSEKGHIKHWKRLLGDTRLTNLNPTRIREAMGSLREQGLAPQTINYCLVTLRCILTMAVEDQILTQLPVAPKMWLKTERVKRPVFTIGEMEKLCATALTCSRNGKQFVDYFRFLCFSGARASEALRIKWAHVDFDSRQILIGADGDTKNRKSRVVDFNEDLEQLLAGMHRNRSMSEWLFVSAQRGNEGQRARSFRETLIKARELAGLGEARRKSTGYALSFHCCRHLFISQCCMSGIDFLSIAAWVGHQDGGLLISRTYAHITNQHLRSSAQKVCFKPQLIDGGLRVA